MMGNKEAELTTAIMLYAIRCLAEGDQSALRNMNFGPREVEALRDTSKIGASRSLLIAAIVPGMLNAGKVLYRARDTDGDVQDPAR